MTASVRPLVASDNFLARSAVPLRFPQFRNAAALAHLAHVGRGPRYVVIGGRAWYDPADIVEWLEANKRCGPARARPAAKSPFANAPHETQKPKKIGRPTKAEQMRRRLGTAAPMIQA